MKYIMLLLSALAGIMLSHAVSFPIRAVQRAS